LLYNNDSSDIKNDISTDMKYYSLNHIILSYSLNSIILEVVVSHNTASIRLSYFSKLSQFFLVTYKIRLRGWV